MILNHVLKMLDIHKLKLYIYREQAAVIICKLQALPLFIFLE